MLSPEPVRRTIEIEEPTNRYIIHPVAGRLTALLAKLNVSPNAVSLAGMVCGLLAGVAYFHYRAFGFTVVGLALMIAWHVLDGADGQLARLTQKQSHSGKILDGICDYVTFTSVYIGLALAINQDHGRWIWGLVSLSGICHALQAAAYEVQRQDYEFWGLGKGAAKVPDLGVSGKSANPSETHRFGESLYRLYVGLQLLTTGFDLQSRRRLTTIMAEATDQAEVRRQYRKVFAPSVRRWSIMSANYRTLAIFLFSAINAPITYFVFEAIGLSALLVALLLGRQKRYAMLFKGLGEAVWASRQVKQAVAGESQRA